jgi:hypothetical protein
VRRELHCGGYHRSISGRRVLVACELQSYRQALAAAFREVRSEVEVFEVEKDDLDRELSETLRLEDVGGAKLQASQAPVGLLRLPGALRSRHPASLADGVVRVLFLLVGVRAAARFAQGGDGRSGTREAARAGETRYRGEKEEQCCSQRSDRGMLSSWPVALREVQRWLDPWVMLWRFWRAWSNAPPPPALQALLDAVGSGQPLRFSFYVY